MPKNIEDIIVPERKRSIRDIPIPEGRRRNEESPVPSLPQEQYHAPTLSRNSFDLPQEERKYTTSSWRGRKNLWLATGAALIVLIFAVLAIFNGATLAYVPKSQTLSFENDTYTAHKTGEGKLLYSVVKLSKDKGLDVSVSGEEEVSRKASGTIVVYNNASAESERLIANTRFETPDGLIYRVAEAIVIPGKKTVNGVIQPGTLEVTVYADQPGDTYNITLADFTVPGLAGSSKFNTIYARSKTKMSGGFVGREMVVNSQDKLETKTKLETALRDELTAEAKAQVPDEFILFPTLSSVTFEDLPQTNSTNKDGVVLNIRGNLNGVMFKRSDLSNHLALGKITPVAGESVDILTLDSLSFSFVDTSPADLLLSDKLNFSVAGEVTAVWRTDEVALKADLVGKHKIGISSILNNYPTIISATATIRPFWKSSFPSDSADITIRKLPVK